MSSWVRQWQPVRSEDQITALIFGFFRHAPAEIALSPWLSGLLERTVIAAPLEARNFWPWQLDGPGRVVPDLCFEVLVNGRKVLVVIEAKRTTEEHTLPQLRGEVRAAHALNPLLDIALITVGSKLHLSVPVEELEAEAGTVEVSHAHASWASLGDVLANVREPGWARYAGDIRGRMRRLGLLNEPGLPELPVEAAAALDAVNRLTVGARDFIKVVNAEIAEPAGCVMPRGNPVWRTGTSTAQEASQAWWTQGVVYGSWARPHWREPQRVFVALDLRPLDGPKILVGPAWAANGALTQLMVEGEPTVAPVNESLHRLGAGFPHRWAFQGQHRLRDFRFDRRKWSADVRGDTAWTSEQFERALDVAEHLTDALEPGPSVEEGSEADIDRNLEG